jgi:hypothetical protein
MAERAPPIAEHFSWGIALSRDMAAFSATKANDTPGASVCRMLTNNAACVTLKERFMLSLYMESKHSQQDQGRSCCCELACIFHTVPLDVVLAGQNIAETGKTLNMNPH